MVDTNVIVSALLSPGSPPAVVLRAALAGHLKPCFDDRVLAEYWDVLPRGKFPFGAALAEEVISGLKRKGLFIVANPVAVELPDPSDKRSLKWPWPGGWITSSPAT